MDKTSQKCDDVGYALSKTIEQLLAEHSPLIGLVHCHLKFHPHRAMPQEFHAYFYNIGISYSSAFRLSSHLNISISQLDHYILYSADLDNITMIDCYPTIF